MTRLRYWFDYASAAALFAAPALAQVYPTGLPAPRMSLAGPDAECFERIRIENRHGYYHRTETLEIAGHGAVSIAYETVGAHAPGDDDRIEVVALPPTLIARPERASIPDGAALIVCLVEWVGG